jgi:hypothetical protein
MKMGLIRRLCFGMLQFCLLHMLHIEAFFPCHVQEVYAVQKFCIGTVPDHCGELFEFNSEIFPTHVLPSMLISQDYTAWLPKVFPHF